MAALPWETFDSRTLENGDRGVTIAYIAQQASVSPRTVFRAFHGGGVPERDAFDAWNALPEAERKLDRRGRPKRRRLDPELSLIKLGLVDVEVREGRASHYRVNLARFRELSARAQRKVLDHIDGRDARNAGKQPGSPGYERPNVPALPSADDVAGGDAVPAWVGDVEDRAGLYAAIATIDHELYGAPVDAATERAHHQRLPGLHEPVARLWVARGCPAWADLAAEVGRYTRTVRTCRNVTILTEWRGFARDWNGLRQKNTDWTHPSRLTPSKFLANKRVSKALAIAELHDAGTGACGCGRCDEAPAPVAPDEVGEAGPVVRTLLGPTTAETDAAGLWTRTLARMGDRIGRQDVEIWLRPCEAAIADGRLVITVSNAYYTEWVCDEYGDALVAEAGCGIGFRERDRIRQG